MRQQDHQERYDDISEEDTEDPMVLNSPSFDILEWHPAFQSCQRYFLDHAQYEPATQAVCALINIRLPFQDFENPITSSTHQSFHSSSPTQHFFYPPSRSAQNSPGPGAGSGSGNLSPYAHHNLIAGHQSPNLPRPNPGGGPGSSSTSSKSSHQLPTHQQQTQQAQHQFKQYDQQTNPTHLRSTATPPPPPFISLLPYIRRLVVTNFDNPAILHGFFGDAWRIGILPHVQCERRNYLFAAKSGGWRSCKKQYDAGSGFGRNGEDESVPFLKPLGDAKAEELAAAEKAWSEWLAMEDWMVGPDAPGQERRRSSGGAAGGAAGRRGGRRSDGGE
jgi:hypothetical protein